LDELCDIKRVIEITDLTKKYISGGGKVILALDAVSLHVEQGSFVAIMGPSGCGKSTLLHCLGGLDQADSGQIFVDKQNLTDLSEEKLTLYRRDRIGFVFQFFNLLPTLTVWENIILPVTLGGKLDATVETYATHLLRETGLEERRHHLPHQLSGGEMQRAALARALVKKPALVLGDEPTGNLDSVTSERLVYLLKSLCYKEGTTLVVVTHSHELASHADRIIRMRDGKIEA